MERHLFQTKSSLPLPLTPAILAAAAAPFIAVLTRTQHPEIANLWNWARHVDSNYMIVFIAASAWILLVAGMCVAAFALVKVDTSHHRAEALAPRTGSPPHESWQQLVLGVMLAVACFTLGGVAGMQSTQHPLPARIRWQRTMIRVPTPEVLWIEIGRSPTRVPAGLV